MVERIYMVKPKTKQKNRSSIRGGATLRGKMSTGRSKGRDPLAAASKDGKGTIARKWTEGSGRTGRGSGSCDSPDRQVRRRLDHASPVNTGTSSVSRPAASAWISHWVVEAFLVAASSRSTVRNLPARRRYIHRCGKRTEDRRPAAFIDAEHALDPTCARRLGVDLDSLLVSQPDTGEQALEICELLVRSRAVDVVVDSVAALIPRAEIEGEMGDTHVGLQRGS